MADPVRKETLELAKDAFGEDGEARVFRICLTGGPCGGKTTACAMLSESLESRGWKVYRVPEAASVLMAGGITFGNLTAEQQYQFQLQTVNLMIQLEDSFAAIAKARGTRAIILCDRGVMDAKAYIKDEMWARLLGELGQKESQLRDQRYDCVLHLVSAAVGAEAFYNTHEGATRTEPAHEAAELDERIKQNWVGHPCFRVFSNGVNFKTKMKECMDALCDVVGTQSRGLVKRKFLVTMAPDKKDFPVNVQEYDVEHNYLTTNDETQARLRKRGQNGNHTYIHTVRYPGKSGQRLELKRILTGRSYIDLMSQADPKRVPVSKRRLSFLWNKECYFELDIFISPHPGLMLLEAYMDEKDESPDLPDFLEVEGEVTRDPRYSMYNLAEKRNKDPSDRVFDMTYDHDGK